MKVRDLLVGSTGFVGGNLINSHQFTHTCHSTDIHEYFASSPDLCIYAGVPSAMYLANSNPDADLDIIKTARNNIRKINPKKIVLISTIAVYQDSKGKDEYSPIDRENLSAYGKNRLQLERWVKEDFEEVLIIRLPALYGKGLKKNFLYDIHTIVPFMLNRNKYEELSVKSDYVKNGYIQKENGFYYLNASVSSANLKTFFAGNDFNALSFTDSRSKYQFYNLGRLWNDINKVMEEEIDIVNLCTPPVSAKEVYEYITGDASWKNELPKEPFDYDLHSRYSEILGGKGVYLCTAEQELKDIKKFMETWVD